MTVRQFLVACALACGLAATARAQGYETSTATRLVETRPASATALDVDSVHGTKASVAVTLPFEFRYYGRSSASLVVSAHGWVLPGATSGLTVPSVPAGLGEAGADGVVAPLWTTYTAVNDGTPDAGRAFTWTSGEAPTRRFVVSWEGVTVAGRARSTVQVHLHEGPGRIVFAYALPDVTGLAPSSVGIVCGLDEPGGVRFTAPIADGRVPASDFVLEPRTVLFNSADAPKDGLEAAWQDVRRESLTAPGSAKGACYVAKGRGWFFVPDRTRRRALLVDEDEAAFHGAVGNPERWVKQVMDAKAILVPKDGGASVRVWFRIIEWFTVDDTGLAGPDDHVWNLRKMLHMAFEDGDPRGEIATYCAWRGMVSARLSVVKLFDFGEKDDAGRQFDTNRKNEYVLWCARFRTGVRGPLAPDEAPRAGWTPFVLKDENLDRAALQHADSGDLRDVADPNYVDGGYRYVIRSDGPVPGWEALGTAPRSALTDEQFDDDPGGAGTVTPR